MAEEAIDDGAAGGRKRGSKRLIIVGLAALLLMVGTAAALYFSGIASTLLGKGEEKVEKKVEAPPPAPKVAVFYDDLPDMLVNLNTGTRKSSFLKLHVSLQIEGEEDKAKIKLVQARIIDTFQTYLRELRLEDLKGSAGLYRLREELLMRVNAAVAPVKVDDVLFTEMLVQ
ncbi:MAG TPA: flagellar basal body-associated FliL family protein [Aliidongia sp.]|uniref:flagellar basal body-associated FliL family protein n=1 Tax=Aliidongia sp. TaxID=1914230 RepID=UPI002DDD5964|nr:flagellar basal body-associated FliL family protein [Aliidongia sp.]HEV2674077.1 flagellar basal body-associated FliL family protein [Aliidongia sp.]